jgi:glycosyltransferase involved in cell wall biosynthesis
MQNQKQAIGVPELSLVVPLYDEQDSVRPLVDQIRSALESRPNWELLLVDDGSRDETAARASACAAEDPRVRVLRLARNYGQTQAMQAGFDHARADIVATLDGDLQNDPRDIPLLIDTLHEGYDLVTGYRVNRKDAFLTRTVPSWVANRLIAALTGVRVRDNGCSLKVYRRDVLRRLDLYSDMHRFLPALAHATTGARIAEVPVRHHPRTTGSSKYGLTRIFKILADLLIIKMITSFRERPLVMFGTAALGAALLAFAAAVFSVFSISMGDVRMIRGYVVPSIMILWMLLAGFLLLLGMVGEVALRASGFARGGARVEQQP